MYDVVVVVGLLAVAFTAYQKGRTDAACKDFFPRIDRLLTILEKMHAKHMKEQK